MKHLPLKRPARTATVALASAAVTAALTLPGIALAHGGHDHGHGAVPAPPAVPTSADQIQNIDQVKTAIKGYYGDTVTDVNDPVAGTTKLHQFNPDGDYAHEVEGIAADAGKFLAHQQAGPPRAGPLLRHAGDPVRHRRHHAEHVQLRDLQQLRVQPDHERRLRQRRLGRGLPGRPGHGRASSEGRDRQGLPGVLPDRAAEDRQRPTRHRHDQPPGRRLHRRPHARLPQGRHGATVPWLASCAPTCTTTQYKSLTRQHIESLGFDIVANFGDQFSDLNGGFADRTFKIPNPMYFLP